MPKVKPTKTERKSLKLTPLLLELMNKEQKNLNRKFNSLVDTALYIYYTDDTNFISCPKCRAHLCDLNTISLCGVVTIDCNCGNQVVYDLDTNEFLKGGI